MRSEGTARHEAAHRLYIGQVMHRRYFPVRYRFAYSVFSLLLDIDRVAALARAVPVFSLNRFNLLGFYERDHGPRDGSALRPWLERLLAGHGLAAPARVWLHAMPRVFGYAFNPLSVYYCYDALERPVAIVCEVKNTFGEQHCYVLHDEGRALRFPLQATRPKAFHVSPFIDMHGCYDFRFSAPGEHLAIAIRHRTQEATQLAAVQRGRARPCTTGSLLGAALKMPLVTLKVTAMIHWQALRIWLRGATLYRKPAPPEEGFS